MKASQSFGCSRSAASAVPGHSYGRLAMAGRCSQLPHSVRTCVAARAERIRDKVKIEAQDLEFTEQRPFFEPALRSFALGLGTGVLMELGHVCFSLGVETKTNAKSLSALLPQALQLDVLDPLVFWDNFAAMLSFAAFYGLEVAAIVAVLKQFPNDTRKATQAIMQLPTLPKLLVPNLPSIRRSMYAWLNNRRNHGATASGIPTTSGEATFSSEKAPVQELSTESLAPTASSFVDAGSSTAFKDAPPSWKGPIAPPVTPGAMPLPTPLPPFSTPKPPSPVRQAPGAWAPSELAPQTLKRARELQERRGFLKNFWYCVALSQQLSQEEPLEVAILGRTVALFRDVEGRAHCLDNVCPHRGAPLARGWVKDVSPADGEGDLHSCVVCPYHGWAFDTTGKLREVPSNRDQSNLPKRALVSAYPVEERGGFVWLFFGSSAIPPEERPPIPFVPELEDPNWKAVYGELEFDAPHWNVFDNAIDMAHIHYLHGDSFGNQSKPEIMDMKMKRDAFFVSGSFRIHNKPVNALWEFTSRDAVPVEVIAFLPSTSSIKITLGRGIQMITFVNTVPIDANRSVNRFCLIRNFAGWNAFDKWAEDAMFKILGEDKVMVEVLQPEKTRAEVSLGADLPQVAFRALRSEWAQLGYIADPDVLSSFEGPLDM